MARRKVLRSWLTATVLVLSGTAAVSVAPSPAGAADPDVTVKVYATYFQAPDGTTNPAKIYAKPEQRIVFQLVDPADTRHTVTLDPGACENRPTRLCEQRFDDPRDPVVDFRFSTEKEYGFYDRYADDAGRQMRGVFVITSAPATVPPPTTSTTVPSTTSTTAPTTTTTSPTTTTTAPTSIHPFLIPDPTTTTTTAVATTGPPPPTTAPANKDNGKDKGKKAASPSTPTTAAPAPPNAMPPDSVFDPAALTPGPTVLPAPDGSNSEDEAALDASAAASLLDPQKAGDDGGKLLLMAFGALAMLLLLCGGWAWFTRSSQYDPA